MDLSTLSNILMELKTASSYVNQNPTDGNLRSLMDKYNMLFLGENFNCIYSSELTHAINNVFKIQVTNEEITAHIPIVCTALHMDYEPMVAVKDVSNPNPGLACYKITL